MCETHAKTWWHEETDDWILEHKHQIELSFVRMLENLKQSSTEAGLDIHTYARYCSEHRRLCVNNYILLHKNIHS